MSFDGTFSVDSSIERLLYRHPNLRSDPKLVSLSLKGKDVTHVEVVEVLADLFLHPDYTVPVMGCFRPLARMIVERAIKKLQTVPSLDSQATDDGHGEEEIGESEFGVVNFYVGRGSGLRLHELACLALCRALDLAPFLLSSMQSYFVFSLPPFKRLLLNGSSWKLGEQDAFHLLDAVRVSYRFLLTEPKTFVGLWDWSCFLDLVEQTSVLDIGDSDATSSLKLDIRWCTIQILALVLRISDGAAKTFGMGISDAFMCLQRDLKSPWNPFVLTSVVRKSYEMVLMAVSQKWPVLLHGPVGVGKSAIVNWLAQVSGNHVLCIHMDEQMDSKTLIGSYICSEIPGEFRWQPGSLTQVISVPESFRLFATISTSNAENYHAGEGRFSFNALWRKVMVGTASAADMMEIINARYPNLESLSFRLADTFQRVKSLAACQFGGLNAGVVAGISSRFTMRDLLKWCNRIADLGLLFSAPAPSTYDCQKIYQEAVDIFVACLPSSENRLLAMREIARMWGVLEPESVYPPSEPVIQSLRSGLQVGRITFQSCRLQSIRLDHLLVFAVPCMFWREFLLPLNIANPFFWLVKLVLEKLHLFRIWL